MAVGCPGGQAFVIQVVSRPSASPGLSSYTLKKIQISTGVNLEVRMSIFEDSNRWMTP